MSVQSHLKKIEKKIRFIRLNLLPILLKNHFKLNNNLFIVLILPLYRLIFVLSTFNSNTEKQTLAKHIKKYYKKFCCLPKSTPNMMI